MLRRLLYISQLRSSATAAQIDDILSVSRRNNAEIGLTGILAIADSAALQVIEGDIDTVETLFEVIACDPRHHSVQVVSTGRCQSRLFGRWTMAYTDAMPPKDSFDDPDALIRMLARRAHGDLSPSPGRGSR